MLGEFINSILVMILGFAYPAFECFKTLERSRVDLNDLRFWCQYWIIVAILSVFERFGDIFISWVPMYAEMKLGFIIYLWYPKTKGTSYVYDTLLRPFVVRHEIDIDQYLEELRYRAWDAAIFYWQNCTELGQGAFLQVINFVLNQSTRIRGGAGGNQRNTQPRGGGRGGPPLPAAPQPGVSQQAPPPPSAGPADFIPPHRPSADHLAASSALQRRRAATPEPSAPPMPGAAAPYPAAPVPGTGTPYRAPPPMPGAAAPYPAAPVPGTGAPYRAPPPMPGTGAPYYRSMVQPAQSQVVKVDLDEAHTEYVHIEEDEALGMEYSLPGSPKQRSHFAGLRLRRSR